MNRVLIFVLGVISGCVITIAAAYIYVAVSGTNSNGITMAEDKVPFTCSTKFKVMQVISDGALAECEETISMGGETDFSFSSYSGPVVYILAEGQNQFYDNQIIEVPANKKAFQIGTFQYETRLGYKVVPVIEFR